MKLVLLPFFMIFNPFLPGISPHFELESIYGFNSFTRPQYEVLFNQSFPYRQVFAGDDYKPDDSAFPASDQGRQDFYANWKTAGENESSAAADALNRFVDDNPGLHALSQAEIDSAVQTVFNVLLGSDNFETDHINEVIKDFGKGSSREAKILFLQLFAGLTEKVYDSSKLAQDWTWEKKGRRTSVSEMLAAMRDWLQGGDSKAGVCYDTELMMNELAPLLDLQGAIVLGCNRFGNLHPEGLFFDTSDPKQTVAILQDWSNLVIIPVNTPTQLADALSEITGTHLLGRVIYNADGEPLTMIHSTSELITLGYLGYREPVARMKELSTDRSERKNYLSEESSRAATITFKGLRFEVREYKNPVADYNLMYNLFLNSEYEQPQNFVHKQETTFGFQHEYPGAFSNYYIQETNEHVEFFFRHFGEIATRERDLVSGLLSYSLYTSCETIVGYYIHKGSHYKPGISLPIVELTSGGKLSIGDKKAVGFEFSLMPFITGNLFLPQEIAESVGSVSNYMNYTLKEAHLAGNVSVTLNNKQYGFFQTDYAYSNIEHRLEFSLGVEDERGLELELFYHRGFTNNNFPVFYNQDSSVIGCGLTYDFKNKPGLFFTESGLNVFFEAEPEVKQAKIGLAGYFRV